MTKTPAQVLTIPFADLVAPEEINARAGKTDKTADAELAASIAAKGLIHPLVVRPADGGKHEVIDGRRRYRVLAGLVKARKLARTFEVPAIVRHDDDAEALETSLVANTVRLPLHAVDQHECFARLADTGLEPAEIAARFALSEKTVRQHLALGRLAPEIRDAWRRGKIDAKTAQTFTLSPNHALQGAVYERLTKGRNLYEHSIRSELSADRPKAADVPAALLERYTAAGGTISEDLFEDARYLDNGALLKQCRAEALDSERQRWLDDGWSWVAVASELPHGWYWNWARIKLASDEPAYTKAEKRRRDEILLTERRDGTTSDAADAEMLELRATARLYSAEDKARSGVVLQQDEWNTAALDFTFGVIRPDGAQAPATDEDIAGVLAAQGAARRAMAGEDADAGEEHDGDQPSAEPAGREISQALLLTLTETLTAAAARALATDPTLALCAAIAAIGASAWDTPVKLRSDGFAYQAEAADRAAARVLDEAPLGFAESLAALEGMPLDELLQTWAGLVAGALDLRKVHNPAFYGVRQSDAGDRALVAALPADGYLSAARELFLAEDYFKRARKDAILTALDEMTGGVWGSSPQFRQSKKKSELAETAARWAKERGWLPPELRHPAYALLPREEPEPRTKRRRRLTGKDAAAEQRSETEE